MARAFSHLRSNRSNLQLWIWKYIACRIQAHQHRTAILQAFLVMRKNVHLGNRVVLDTKISGKPVLTCGLMNLANIGNLITYCFERYSNQMTMVFQEKFRGPRTPKSPLATSNHQGLSRVPYIGQAENVPTDFLTIVAT
ncbi:uncharacterized protein PADG_05949 [Paracoccidioides brasiliensis Pb18]|uniref:Uncharacterized protein n=1 Tax=Paracoccidioides brasiliensis (strain Pb18) TaxID=502780 RepID=C1GFB3_PARBD|nr:uncharacterized protein PADG_05949 [Paracoccidioides brasiliensis Pb18]EEH49870.2 hypothetical protein PADG_05949 [Paracoccidioides brasiliensis Pb18]